MTLITSNVRLLEEPGAGHEVSDLLLKVGVLVAVILPLPVLSHDVQLVPGGGVQWGPPDDPHALCGGAWHTIN